VELNELGAAMELIPPQIDAVRQAAESKFATVAAQLRDMREWEVDELEKASKALSTAVLGLQNDAQKQEVQLKAAITMADNALQLKIKKVADDVKEFSNVWEAIERAESTAEKSELVIERFVLEINTIKGEVNTIVEQVEKRFDVILNEVLPSALESFDSRQEARWELLPAKLTALRDYMEAHVSGLKTADAELHEACMFHLDSKMSKLSHEIQKGHDMTVAQVERITEDRNQALSKVVMGKQEQLHDQMESFKRETIHHVEEVTASQEAERTTGAIRQQHDIVGAFDSKLRQASTLFESRLETDLARQGAQQAQRTEHLVGAVLSSKVSEMKLDEMAHAQRLNEIMDQRQIALQEQMRTFKQDALAEIDSITDARSRGGYLPNVEVSHERGTTTPAGTHHSALRSRSPDTHAPPRYGAEQPNSLR